jgi:signal peptidase I
MRGIKGWKELALLFIMAIAAAFLVRTFFWTPYRVPTGSMQPALKPGDFIFVSQVAYGMTGLSGQRYGAKDPQRGDVVTFFYPNQPGIAYVKRVIGLPGDTVEIRNNRLMINDVELAYTQIEDSVDNPNPDLFEVFMEKTEDQAWKVIFKKVDVEKTPVKPKIPASMGPLLVPRGEVFLLGDNRDASDDSRYWGTVPTSQIFGRVAVIWLSLDWQHAWANHRFPSVRWGRIFSTVH